MAVWIGEFEDGERWLRRGWEVAHADIDPAVAVLLHMVTGMLHAGRGEDRSALEAFTAAVHAQSLLTGVHILAPVIAEWLARLGMPDEARATLDEFSTEHEWVDAIDLAQAAIRLGEGDPATALAVLGDVQRMRAPLGSPAYALVEAHLLAGLAHLALGDRNAAAAAAEAALAAAEPDRLILPFAMFNTADLLDVLAAHQTAHSALLADVVDLLAGRPATDRPAASTATGSTQPKRATGAASPANKSHAARDRPIAPRVGQHGQHTYPQYLLQARRD